MKYNAVLLLLILFVFVGAGCSKKETNFEKSIANDAEGELINSEIINDSSDEHNNSESNSYAEISLQASAGIDGSVFLEWTPNSIESEGKIRLLRSQFSTPTIENSYWFDQSGNTSITWINNPEGTFYFRACLLEGNTCSKFSNTIQVSTVGGSLNKEKRTSLDLVRHYLTNSTETQYEGLTQNDALLGILAEKPTILSLKHTSPTEVSATIKDTTNNTHVLHIPVQVSKMGVWSILNVELQ